jgi:hypothetical protein
MITLLKDPQSFANPAVPLYILRFDELDISAILFDGADILAPYINIENPPRTPGYGFGPHLG